MTLLSPGLCVCWLSFSPRQKSFLALGKEVMLQKTSKFAVYSGVGITSDAVGMVASSGSSSVRTVVSAGPPKDEPFDPKADVLRPQVDLRSLVEKEDIFQAIYCNFSSPKTAYISLQERKAISADKSNKLHGAHSLTYGEIRDLESMTHVLEVLQSHGHLPPAGQAVFYDLGSGSGKVVFAASLLFPFRFARGIEILSSLHEIAQTAAQYYQSYFDSPDLRFYHGSILDLSLCDWTDGDVVFVNSTCFHNDLFRDMARIAINLKIGTVMITLSQQLPAWTGFKLFHESRENMSWGMADFYYHIKQTQGQNPDHIS